MRKNRGEDEDPNDVVDALRKRASVDWGRDFLDRHGANAVSVGWKWSEGRPTRVISVRLHVPPGLKSKPRKGVDYIKKHLECGATPDGRELVVETDVDECSRPRFSRQQDPMAPHRRIPGGVSIGVSVSGTENVGTFGGWAWDRELLAPVLISAAHVFGDQKGAPVRQPAKADRLAVRARNVGSVNRFTTVLPGGRNTVDAATAMMRRPSLASLRVLQVGPAIMATHMPLLDLPVEKFGKTSLHTRGMISDPFWEGWVQLSGGGPWVIYSDCLRIIEQNRGTWAEPGDSGSIVFAQDPLADGSGVKPAIGLHFAADETDPRIGIACRIDNVFTELNLLPFPHGLMQQVVRPLGERAVHQITEILPGLRARLQSGEGGLELLDLFERHRVALVQALLRSKLVRSSLTAAAKAVFADAPTVASVLDEPMPRRTTTAVVEFLTTLRDDTEGTIRRNCTALLRRLENSGGQAARDILKLGDNVFEPVLDSGTGTTVTPEQLYRKYVELFGSDLMQRFHAIAVSAGRPSGSDAPGALAVKFFALPERLEALRRRVPAELVWERPGQPPMRLRTAVEASRPVRKR